MNLMLLMLALVSLVTLPCALWAATYYVSATGNDANSGTRNALAWKTTNKINNTTMALGDDVLFKCGDTWVMGGSNPGLVVDWNGTTANPVVIGAYYVDTDGVTEIRGVQGAKPVFDGNNAYPSETTGLITSSGRQHIVYENFMIQRSTGRGLAVKDDSPNYDLTIRNLTIEHTYADALILYSVDLGLIEGCDFSWANEKRKTITDSTIPAVQFFANNTRIIFRHNTLHENYGHGIWVRTQNSHCVFENNVIYNSKGQNFTLGEGSTECDIRGNIIVGLTNPLPPGWTQSSPKIGIDLADWGSTYKHQRNRIYNNLIANCENGVFIQTDDGVTLYDTFVYSNTLVDNRTNISVRGPFSNCAVRNNIIWSITPGDSIPAAFNNSSGLSFDHNYWSLTPTAAAKGTGDIYGGVPLLYKTTGWRSIAPGGLSAADCEIAASSPGFNAGADLSATYAMDITGTARPRLQGWDMGAWERVSENQMEHLSLTTVPFNLLYTETGTNLVMQMDCQAKNYDVLVSLRIANTGSAIAARDLTNLRLWHLSGGAGLPFNPSQAAVIGSFSPVSDASWLISTALTLQDHDTLYVTADIPSGAKGGNTVQFSLPANGAVFQYSQPLELVGLLNPYVQAIRSAILLTLDTEPLGTVNVLQGQTNVPLGRVWLKNVSGDMLNLVSLELTLQAKSGLPKDPKLCFSQLRLLRGSQIVSTANSPFPLGALFNFSPALVLTNQESIALDVYADVLADPELEGFRLQVANAAALNSGQIQSSPVEGKLFPLTVADVNIRPPSAETVFSSFPNPFKPSSGPMRVAYYLESAGEAELSVWTLSGRRVATLEQADKPAGLYEIPWDGKNEQGRAVVSGPYLLRLELRYVDAPAQRFSRKFVVAR